MSDDKKELKSIDEEVKALAKGKISMEGEIVSVLKQQLKDAQILKWLGVGVGVLGIASVALMLPLKTTDIYLAKTDPSTGFTVLTKVTGPMDVEGDSLMDAYWAQNYVFWRESYSFAGAQASYDKTMLFSSPSEQVKYDKLWAGDEGLDKKYRDNLEILISDVTAIVDNKRTPTTAVVRYKATYKYANKAPEYKRFIATFSYSYDPTAVMTERDRMDNIMNFRVDGYVTQEEVGR